jgi:hypothetical protein
MSRATYVYIVIQEEIKGAFTVKYEMINYLKKLDSLKKMRVIRTRYDTEVQDVTEQIMKELE